MAPKRAPFTFYHSIPSAPLHLSCVFLTPLAVHLVVTCRRRTNVFAVVTKKRRSCLPGVAEVNLFHAFGMRLSVRLRSERDHWGWCILYACLVMCSTLIVLRLRVQHYLKLGNIWSFYNISGVAGSPEFLIVTSNLACIHTGLPVKRTCSLVICSKKQDQRRDGE